MDLLLLPRLGNTFKVIESVGLSTSQGRSVDVKTRSHHDDQRISGGPGLFFNFTGVWWIARNGGKIEWWHSYHWWRVSIFPWTQWCQWCPHRTHPTHPATRMIFWSWRTFVQGQDMPLRRRIPGIAKPTGESQVAKFGAYPGVYQLSFKWSGLCIFLPILCDTCTGFSIA